MNYSILHYMEFLYFRNIVLSALGSLEDRFPRCSTVPELRTPGDFLTSHF